MKEQPLRTLEILLLLLVALFFVWRFFIFFRNPKRIPPAMAHLVISPADGYICYIKHIARNEIPIATKHTAMIRLEEYSGFIEKQHEEYWLVGIYMSVFDVHYNRAPIEGSVEMLRRFFPAKNRSMAGVLINLLLNRTPMDQNSDFLLTNERCSTWIKGDGISVGMIQIADRWISDIIPYITQNQVVKQGDVVGLIRMGSQVDLLIPTTARLDCKLRQRVKAGQTILARY